MPKPSLLIAAGGTGGHVFPALAVAHAQRDAGWNVEWLGSPRGIENRVVPDNDITLHVLKVSGVRGSGVKRLLIAPFMLLGALFQAIAVLRTVKPSVVLGMGGFAAGPGCLAAKILGIPVVIHEQNAIPGMTNAILARFANRRLEAFDGAFLSKGIRGGIAVGNPVRQAIIDAATENTIGEQLNVLVVGGSLGAVALNEKVPAVLAGLSEHCSLSIRHQCGKNRSQTVVDTYKNLNIHADVMDFIEDMAAALAWANIVVCRSGAMTVAELAIMGRPAVFIPFPYAVDDHQTANAEWLTSRGAGMVCQQATLTEDALCAAMVDMTKNRQTLEAMSEAARNAAQPEATRNVCRHLEELANG